MLIFGLSQLLVTKLIYGYNSVRGAKLTDTLVVVHTIIVIIAIKL